MMHTFGNLRATTLCPNGPPPTPNPFTFGQRLGLFMTFEGSLLSGISVTFILLYALYRRIRNTRNSAQTPSDATGSILFLNLMLADLVQALGAMPNVKWMADGFVQEGTLCTAQAVLKQVGIVGVSITSLAIALHTFSILVLRWIGPRSLPKYAVIGIWTFTAFELGIANLVHRKDKYYGRTGYWCWITPQFKPEQIVTEYLWVWLSGFSMIILYSIMFVVIRRRRFQVDRGVKSWESDEVKKVKMIANSMLFYPAVYVFCVFPNSLARWLSFTDQCSPPPYQAILFANTIYGLSGLFDLILFVLTRPKVVLGSKPVVPLIPIRRREDHMQNSYQNMKRLSENDYGKSSVDVDPRESRFEPKSPFRLGITNQSYVPYDGFGTVRSSAAMSLGDMHRGVSSITDIH